MDLVAVVFFWWVDWFYLRDVWRELRCVSDNRVNKNRYAGYLGDIFVFFAWSRSKNIITSPTVVVSGVKIIVTE